MDQDQSGKGTPSTQLNDEKALGPLSDGAKTTSIESQGKPVPALTNHLNLEEIRLSQDYASTVGVKKVLTTVPIRKPGKQTFFRVHPDPNYRLPVLLLEMKETVGVETYLVMPHLCAELAGETTAKMLHTCITRQGDCFLWPIKLLGPDGRLDQWNQSALDAAEMGAHTWIRLVPNLALGAYDVYQAVDNLPEPKWLDASFQELVDLAFKGKTIEDYEHPILRQLRGAS